MHLAWNSIATKICLKIYGANEYIIYVLCLKSIQLLKIIKSTYVCIRLFCLFMVRNWMFILTFVYDVLVYVWACSLCPPNTIITTQIKTWLQHQTKK